MTTSDERSEESVRDVLAEIHARDESDVHYIIDPDTMNYLARIEAALEAEVPWLTSEQQDAWKTVLDYMEEFNFKDEKTGEKNEPWKACDVLDALFTQPPTPEHAAFVAAAMRVSAYVAGAFPTLADREGAQEGDLLMFAMVDAYAALLAAQKERTDAR